MDTAGHKDRSAVLTDYQKMLMAEIITSEFISCFNKKSLIRKRKFVTSVFYHKEFQLIIDTAVTVYESYLRKRRDIFIDTYVSESFRSVDSVIGIVIRLSVVRIIIL